ncbi:uncharacterized protein LOC116927671 [Daphnia magna]|uniref:Uncharacterized protein n=1 Tax=Daphnia magna TaxID=35525 RepID=A0ABR0ALZ9_9CRUS|nr:uncharacterized protein LOC116927671 [Daphnia magna]XP_032790608.1 uncharacterized protein LOC116927671 [Daphnia magna]XP_032790609.1 uncharacterized protein LOC116927671 [Daphnia magna]KAK4026146.1 hypothetical protein OUZ56_015165 [Daphnia magna]
MRTTIVVALFAVVVAAPTNDKEDIAITSTTNEINVDGNDVHDFDMAEGTEDYEDGKVKKFGTKPEDIGVASKGSYSYNFPGTIITVNWITDEKTKAVHTYIQVSYPMQKPACRSMSCTIDD